MEIIDSTKQSILIIGGTGFIGSYIAEEALSRQLNVTIISQGLSSIKDRIDDAEYLEVDITQRDELFLKLKNRVFDYVVNLAGYIDHSNYFKNGDKVVDVHFNGTRNIVEFINKKNLKTYIHFGSSDEYGSNVAPQNESQKELPFSSYSFAKTASTHFLQMLYLTEKFPAVIFRPFLVYGPRQENSRFIPQVILGCLDDKEFPTSYGMQLRDFCFITDIVDAVFLTINNADAYGEVINIGSGEAISIKEIITTIQNIVGLGRPQFGKVAYRDGENMELFANINKAKKLLNWRPKINLQNGLRKTINYYSNK